MTLDLTKGMVLDLTKENAEELRNLSVGVNWGKIETKEVIEKRVGGFLGFGGKIENVEKVVSKENVDLDVSAILYGADNSHVETVYYGNLSTLGIKHSGDDQSGDDDADDTDNEVISINLEKVRPNVTKIVFVLVSFRGHKFHRLPYARINLYNGAEVLATTKVDISKDSSYENKVSMVFAKLEKVNGVWTYKAICEPSNENKLSELVVSSWKF